MRRLGWASPWLLAACAIAGLALAIILAGLGAALLAGPAGACGTGQPAGGPSTLAGIPSTLLPIYEQAAAKYALGVDGWAYLASINDHESAFGTNLSTSSAGAVGWMQFEPGTWALYGVDPQGNRLPFLPQYYDNPADAIFSAANLLHASGAPGDWPGAIYAYNHAGWYVADITATAQQYIASAAGLPQTRFTTAAPVAGQQPCASVAPGRYVDPFASARGVYVTRLDMGVDVAGQGPIDALGDATITYAGTGIGGGWTCGGAYPNGGIVYRLNDGPDRGRLIYVAEDVLPTVHALETVTAGQQIATFAGADCIETGWAARADGVETYASAYGGGYIDGPGCNPTAAGENFYDLLHALGLPASQCRAIAPPAGSHYP